MFTLLFRTAVVFTLAAAIVPASASARPPGSPKPPQDKKEILRLFEQPGSAAIAAAREVSVEEAAALAVKAEGLTPAAALARVTGAEVGVASTASASTTCKAVEYDHHRGIFPYHRWVYGQTTWCYQYAGVITYRVSYTSARVDGVCSGRNARDWKVAGGAGQSWVLVQHEADFSCATPWWYHLNDTLWMRLQFDSYGNASFAGRS